jgi:hypothetical protein
MDVPLDAVAPVSPLSTTVHEKVELPTEDVRAILAAEPLQML